MGERGERGGRKEEKSEGGQRIKEKWEKRR